MKIPGGDLAPARRKSYGSSYGRRRRRRLRSLAGIVVLVLIGGGAAYYLRQNDDGAPARIAAQPTCTPAPVISKPIPKPVRPTAPGAVTLTVLNGTTRNGLATRVADALVADGFHVPTFGNSPKALDGSSQVIYGPGAQAQAKTVTDWVLGSVVVRSAKAHRGSVELVLGSSYQRLATPAEAAAAGRAVAVQPAPTAAATARSC